MNAPPQSWFGELDRLKCCLRGNIVIVAVGNPLRGDDGVGTYLAARLKNAIHWPIIDAGETPENFTDKIAALEPETILILDAGDWSGAPGDLRLLADHQIASGMLSTHGQSLSLFIRFLRQRTSAQVWVLAIQVGCVSLGHPLSAEVKAQSDAVARMLAQVEREGPQQ